MGRRSVVGIVCLAGTLAAPAARAQEPFSVDGEARNYAKIGERAPEYSTPAAQADILALGTANVQESLAEGAADSERGYSTNVCASGFSGCVGDPRLYRWAQDVAGEVRRVLFTARDGATLSGRVWRTASGPPKRPGVVIVPGSVQAPEQLYWWAAQTLAKAGYVVLTFDAQGQGRSDTNGEAPDANEGVPAQTVGTPFFDGAQDALDFLLSTPEKPYVPRRSRTTGTDHALKQRRRVAAGKATAANPFGGMVDPARIGIAGHSYGSFGASWVGQQDPRVKAIVAWDNLCLPNPAPKNLLQSDSSGLTYNLPSDCVEGGRLPPPAVTKPALGITGDYVLTPAPYGSAPDPLAKSVASRAYSAKGVDSGEVVIRGGTHYEFSYLPLPTFPATLRGIDLAAWYTTAWFDKYVKGDPAADARLLSDRWRNDPPGKAVDPAGDANLLSLRYRSRLDIRRAGSGTRVTCEDLRKGCAALVADDGAPRPYSFVTTARAKDAPGVATPAARTCTSRRRVTLTLPHRRGLRVTSATVKVGTGRTRRIAPTRRRTTIVLTGRPQSTVRVVVTVRGRHGVRIRQVRHFKTCTRR